MNILVTGANGQLGQCMRIASVRSADKYFFTDVAELDITDSEAVTRAITDNHIGIIVNCAAYTDVECAEDNKDLAELLNATAVKNLAIAAKANGATLIHISTDYVFGGSRGNTPRDENEPVNPTGIYGLTKLHGEQAIADSGCRAIIIRTAWLYSEFGKNFVKTMLNLTTSLKGLKVVFDQAGTPTYARDLAEAIVSIIDRRQSGGHEGIYHYSNEGVCSWYDFATAIADMAGHDDCVITPCHSDEFPSKVVRPAYSVLDKTLIKRTFGLDIPHWTKSLKTCIKNLKGNET